MESVSQSPQISAIICTYKRTDTLEAAIQSLLNQTLAADKFEVIVVDNNSRDGTADIVKSCQREASTTLTYILETRQGLSFARNRGIAESKSPIVAFLDDDAEAAPQWLESLLEIYADSAETYAVGGPVKPIWEAERPNWLTDDMLRSFSIIDWGDHIRPLTWPERIIGTNCSFRKEVFVQFGHFAEDLGRQGNQLLGNEDTEIQERLHQQHRKVMYTPQAVVHHWVPSARMTKQYMYQRNYGSGRSEALLLARRGQQVVLQQEMYKRLRQFLKLCGYLVILLPFHQKRFDIFRGIAYHSGFLIQSIRLLGGRP